MTKALARILLFCDATVDPTSTIRELGHDAKRLPSIQTYLRACATALSREVAISTSPSRKRVPNFTTIADLADQYASSTSRDFLLTAVLSSIAQIGALLRAVELDPGILITNHDVPVYCVGLCGGVNAATAAACCRTSSDLIAVGPRLAAVMFRLLLTLFDRSMAIEETDQSWTISTPGLNAQFHEPLVASFLEAEGTIPTTRWPYISAESETMATISGPPSTLTRYFQSHTTLQVAKKIQVPVDVACHASHIRFDNIRSIVGNESLWTPFAAKQGFKCISCHSGKAMESVTLDGMLMKAVDEILNHRFCWGTVLQELCGELDQQSVSAVQISAIGPDQVSGVVANKLKSVGIAIQEPRPIGEVSNDLPKMPSSDDIAIVGVSGRLPGGGNDLDRIWKLLQVGKDTHSRIPDDRFSLATHLDPSGQRPNTTSIPFGCFLDEPGEFDARLFNMSPREALQTDPSHRLALMTTHEALEMAGYYPASHGSFARSRIATFFGQTLDDYRDTNAAQDVDIYYISGGVRAFGPGRLNYHFKWEGPSLSVDTACSSSAIAIQLAFQSLRAGECDTAVAGGMNIITGSDMYAGLAKGGFLSKTGGCKTLDETADGYCRGEAVGTVVLKRLADAVADRDNVLGVIKAVATNHSAHAASITRPDAKAQVKVMRQVLLDAGVSPREVDYVEMHGTGTQLGDAAEISSVSEVFGLNRNQHPGPLPVGSLKANFGHSEASAGIGSLIKVLLMLRHNSIPPMIGINTVINPRFPVFTIEKMFINRKEEPFPSMSRPRRIMINSFNATGGNTAMLVEEGPPPELATTDPRSVHVVSVTGRTRRAFLANRSNLLQYLRRNSRLNLGDLAYTTTARRIHYELRRTYTVRSTSSLIDMMNEDVETDRDSQQDHSGKKLVFAFTGQGSHLHEAVRKLYETSPAFRDRLMVCEHICRAQQLPSVIALLDDDSPGAANQAQHQLSIVALQIALVDLLKDWGVIPDAVIGHSIGEYAALYAAGVLTAADALFIVGNRGALIDKHCQKDHHAMLSIFANLSQVGEALSRLSLDECVVACHNGPSSYVVSGPRQQIEQLAGSLSAANIKSTLVKVHYGFHSPQMRDVVDGLEPFCHRVEFNKPRIPVASTMLGEVVTSSGVFDAKYLVRQTLFPVKFTSAVKNLANHFNQTSGCVWVEVGPHPLCSPMVRSTLPAATECTLYTLRHNTNPWQTISDTLAELFAGGFNIAWADYHKDHKRALSLIELPRYAFDLEKYYIPYLNDWKLHKGSRPKPSPDSSPASRRVDPSLAPFHYLESEELSSETAQAVLSCDLSESAIQSMILGHLVEGIGLCPSSVYAYLAYNAAEYLWRRTPSLRSGDLPPLDLGKMEIMSPLKITTSNRPEHLYVTVDWNSATPSSIKVEFDTRSSSKKQSHCTCVLETGNLGPWRQEWQEIDYLVQSRVQLMTEPSNRPIYRLFRDMMYQLFASSIVQYSREYQLCQRISIDYEHNECLAELVMPTDTTRSYRHWGPFCLDALMHTPGFVLNSNPHNPPGTVFIASGWSSLRLPETLQPGVTYLCHCRMLQSGQSGVYIGNVSVIFNNEIVGLCRGLKFHRLKRSSLRKLVGATENLEAGATPPKPETSSQRTDQGSLQPPEPPRRSVSSHETSQTSSLISPARGSPHVETSLNAVSDASKQTVIAEIVRDIAKETGVAEEKLRDDTKLSELGIDSLLSITLLDNFQRRTGLHLQADIFNKCVSLRDLKVSLEAELDCGTTQRGIGKPAQASGQTHTLESSPGKDTYPSQSRLGAKDTPPEQRNSEILCQVIASEVGLQENEVRAAKKLGDLGIDSILSLSIISKYKEKSGNELEATLFSDNSTISGILTTVDQDVSGDLLAEDKTDDASSVTSRSSSPSESTFESEKQPSTPPDLSNVTCVSMLIKGNRQSSKQKLFCLPDGSGSLYSYIHIPELKPGLAVYALDSPFHKNPEDFNLTFEEVAEVYYREIRRIQPSGPYRVAGWSLGGVFAYEVCRLLLQVGERVEHLIMIDSPCPGVLPPLPNCSLDLLEQAGVFQALSTQVKKVAAHTRMHFVKVTSAFNRWDHQTIDDEQRTRLGSVSIIWAQYGVLEHDDEARNTPVSGLDGANADMMKAREWLTGKRTCFDDGGWESLVGKQISCYTVAGNHFSMVFPPVVSELGSVLRKIIS